MSIFDARLPAAHAVRVLIARAEANSAARARGTGRLSVLLDKTGGRALKIFPVAVPNSRTNRRRQTIGHKLEAAPDDRALRRWLSLSTALLTLLVVACGAEKSRAGSNGGVNDDPSGAGAPVVTDIAPGSAPDVTVVETDAGFVALPTSVNVIITADNAYGFGYGSASAMANYFGGVENTASSDIFGCPQGPEKYTVPAADANAGNYLYIVSYADASVTQGVLAQFFRVGGAAVYTGSGAWEVCATGVHFDLGSGGPKLAQVNDQLALCNGAKTDLATTSAGWRRSAASPGGRLAIGEDNTTPRGSPAPGNEFPVACGIDPAARWMWYDWQPARTSGSPFIYPSDEGTMNPMKDFLIFRLAAQFVPASPVN